MENCNLYYFYNGEVKCRNCENDNNNNKQVSILSDSKCSFIPSFKNCLIAANNNECIQCIDTLSSSELIEEFGITDNKVNSSSD